jgi:glycosyltransferase involved in cell wall biosynthesis
MKALELTILIAVKDGADFIDKTLANAIGISKKTGALILVSDNHSTDNTREIIESRSGDIQIIQPVEPLGMAEHWTWATQQVATKYVRLLGHDDFLNVSNVLAHSEILEDRPEVIAVYSDRDYLVTKGNGDESIKKSRGKKDHKLKDQKAVIKSVIRTGTNGIGEPFCVTFRTKLFTSSEMNLIWSARDPIYELETYFNALNFGEFAFCEGKAGLFRIHGKSYSSNVSKYFWQANEHRKWVYEKFNKGEISFISYLTLNISTRFRATLRSVVFWWIR